MKTANTVNFSLNSIFDTVHRHMKPVAKPQPLNLEGARSNFDADGFRIAPMTLAEVNAGPSAIEMSSSSRFESFARGVDYSNFPVYHRPGPSHLTPESSMKGSMIQNSFTKEPTKKTKALFPKKRSSSKFSKRKLGPGVQHIPAPAIIASPSTPKPQIIKPVQQKATRVPLKRKANVNPVLAKADEAISTARNVRMNEVLQLKKNLDNMLKEFVKLKDDREAIARDLVVLKGTLKDLNESLDNSFQRLNFSKSVIDRKGKRIINKPIKAPFAKPSANNQRHIAVDKSLL